MIRWLTALLNAHRESEARKAARSLSLRGSLRTWLNDLRFRRAFRDLDLREDAARRRGETRAVGAVRRERRERLQRYLAGKTA